MRRLGIALLIVCAANPPAGAQPPDAKSPAESLKCIQVRPGFTVELMAAEPLVKSPIAFAWGPDGKFWVVEMGDYPLGVDGKGKPGGRVKFLEKTKPGDGPYDKMTVFLDGLPFPTGVTPYGKGVLVTCAPDIFYAEDTDGDGKADKKEVLFTGFREGNQQHRVNGLVWGLDNWFYGANGDSGGKVKSLKTGKVVDISGRDFRLKPDTGEFEAVTGQTQFGRCRDDWGNWFGCNNSHPMYHFVLDDHYLRRNPYLLPPNPRVEVSVTPGAAEVFPISKPLPRFNNPQSVNHFTSACSVMIYRDDLFGPEFAGNSFVSEPVHNLIHREIVKPKGVTFTSQRAADEQKSEFLASSDNWFRPTTIATGPDGALWIADMYRYVIEHPEWIPNDWQAKLDLRAGQDKGRIYRVYPKEKKPRAIARMDTLPVDELVKHIDSPNGWSRDTAQQQLIAQTDKQLRARAEDLLDRCLRSGSPLGRLHALCTLEGMGQLPLWRTANALRDRHPKLRMHGLRCLEATNEDGITQLLTGIFEETPVFDMYKDPDPQVRMRLAYTLGKWRNGSTAHILADFLRTNADDPYLLAAGLSSITKANGTQVFYWIAQAPNVPAKLLGRASRMAREYGDTLSLLQLMSRFPLGSLGQSNEQWFNRVADLLDEIQEGSRLKASRLEELQNTKQGKEHIRELHEKARKSAASRRARPPERVAAVRLLSRGLGDDKADRKVLTSLLTPQTPDVAQSAAIQALARSKDPLRASLLIAPWKGYSPALRGKALDVLLSWPIWTRQLTEALEKNQIPASEIDTPRRQRLLQHKDAEIRTIAAKVFAASSSPNRGKLVDDYILTLPEKADSQRGAKLFAKTCAACHKVGDVGQQVGPDLASVGDKTVQGMIVAILDPNRNVEARYVNYLAVTKDGRTLTGMIATETSTSVTLVGADGKSHSLLRNDIDELSSTGKSLMPEGLEKDLPPQEMADLIAFVRAGWATVQRNDAPRK